jgi:hypothetical protein
MAPDTTIDLMVQQQVTEEETDVIRAFNDGEVAKPMADILANLSNNESGFLTFISATSRSSLPLLAAIKPRRIEPFEYEEGAAAAAPVEMGEGEGGEEGVEAGEAIRPVRTTPQHQEQTRGNPKPTKIFQAGSASAKSAATQALDRVQSQQYNTAQAIRDEDGGASDPGDSVQHERFGSKALVYPADIQYYRDHATVAAQAELHALHVMQYEEAIEPNGNGFSWWINPVPTADEIKLRDDLMVKGCEQAASMRHM